MDSVDYTSTVAKFRSMIMAWNYTYNERPREPAIFGSWEPGKSQAMVPEPSQLQKKSGAAPKKELQLFRLFSALF